MNNNFEVAKQLLQENGELVGNTSGNSMLPLFRDGRDRAVIRPLSREPKVNDLLLYRKSTTNEVILHRVIKTKGNLVLRGDNLYRNETNISREDILGVMVAFYRGDKYYECQKSLGYKLYVLFIRISFLPRFFIYKVISRLKRLIKR